MDKWIRVTVTPVKVKTVFQQNSIDKRLTCIRERSSVLLKDGDSNQVEKQVEK